MQNARLTSAVVALQDKRDQMSVTALRGIQYNRVKRRSRQRAGHTDRLDIVVELRPQVRGWTLFGCSSRQGQAIIAVA